MSEKISKPLAAGFVDSTAGISGPIDAIDVQATWNGQQLHVVNLLVDTPKLTLVRDKLAEVDVPPGPRVSIGVVVAGGGSVVALWRLVCGSSNTPFFTLPTLL